ncbi:MAG: hypothetical protein P9L96_06505 [Candidatus Gygaella obscura]|nr:hypothetical protein [Candidatus Gygaella obscura]
MKKTFKRLPKNILALVKKIARLADEDGYRIFLVGGFVRDLILGIDNLDLDIVVDGNGLCFARKLYNKLGMDIVVHKRFGTATIVTRERIKLDIATARCESYAAPGVLPEVTFSSIHEDLKRRDFTINAMAIGINKHNFGVVIDYFGGLQDLKKKKIKVLHDVSFIDDPTRILRAIRFKVRFGFKFDKKTSFLLKEAIKRKMLFKVQKHRLRDELILLLKERMPPLYIKELNRLCGLKFLYNDISLFNGLNKTLKNIKKESHWFINSQSSKRKLEEWLVYLIGILDCLKLAGLKKFCFDYALRKKDTKRILSYKEFMLKKKLKLDKTLRPVYLYKIMAPLSYEAIIAILAKVNKRQARMNIISFLEEFHTIRPHINGDIIKELGIKEGPIIKKILSQVHNARINKSISTFEEELSLVRKILKMN